MRIELRRRLEALEGRKVHLCLTDGSRLDDVALVSLDGGTVWVFDGGEDGFVPVDQVTDVWEARPLGRVA